TFMREGINGAAAIYGATENVEVDATVALDRYLFHEVYTRNNVVQGYTYFAAEDSMEKSFHEGDAWKFLLLGDPQMTIRRTSPPAASVHHPEILHCTAGCPRIDVYVEQPLGTPLGGAKVAVWKRSSSPTVLDRFTGEVHDNRYTDATGHAQIPAPALTDG